MRGFFTGMIWGSVVAVLGLGVASQMALAPDKSPTEPQAAKPEAAPAVSAPVALAPAPAEPTPAESAPADPVSEDAAVSAPAALPMPEAPITPAVTPAAPEPTPAPELHTPEIAPVFDPLMNAPAPIQSPPAQPQAAQAAPVQPEAAPEAGTSAPSAPAPAMPATAAPEIASQDEAALLAPAPARPAAPSGDTAPQSAGLSAPARPEASANGPAAPAPSVPATIAPEVAPQDEAASLAPAPARPVAPSGDTAPQSAGLPPPPPLTPEEKALLAPPQEDTSPDSAAALATLPPTPGLGGVVAGVVTGRLPRIGDAPASDAATADPTTAEDSKLLTPLIRFARPFENPSGKPLFAVILIDSGGPEVDRAALAALPFPVTFAIDPTTPGATRAAALYRKAGQEVIMLASGIPQGALAADLQVTFESHAATLPEAVAVLDIETDGFQNNRALASQVITVIKDQGRGVLTWDKGLNAGDQVAQRAGLASGVVFRSLDAEGESAAMQRRYLDRAAFKAAQDGRVMVVGQTRPETIAALLKWALEGRATSVALAPVSATLITP